MMHIHSDEFVIVDIVRPVKASTYFSTGVVISADVQLLMISEKYGNILLGVIYN